MVPFRLANPTLRESSGISIIKRSTIAKGHSQMNSVISSSSAKLIQLTVKTVSCRWQSVPLTPELIRVLVQTPDVYPLIPNT